MSQQSDFGKLLSLLKNIEKKPSKPAEPTVKEKAELDQNVLVVKELMEKQEEIITKMFVSYDILQGRKQTLQAQLDAGEMIHIDNLECRKKFSELNREIYNYEKQMQEIMEKLRGDQQDILTSHGFPFFNGQSTDPDVIANQMWILQPYVYKCIKR